MNESVAALPFAPRFSHHRGEWIPIYLDPLPGSGERLCIGIVAADGSGVRTLPVVRLEHLECAYGLSAQSIAWSAHLVMSEAKAVAENIGLEGLANALEGVEGLSVGDKRMGAGRDLDDLAVLALRQSSALMSIEPQEVLLATEYMAPERSSPIAKAVQRVVVGLRPALRENFSRHFSLSHFARPTVYGFVGQRMVANFASLGGASADTLSGQVDRAKARLWDLEQLQQGVLRDVFGAPMSNRDFTLMACPPISPARVSSPRRPMSGGLLREAIETLEREADKFDIRWRFLRTPQEIASVILEKEAA